MTSRHPLLYFSVLLLALPAAAKTLYVSPAGKADGDGSKVQPFNRVQSALDLAGPGDTVQLAPGVYRERVRFVRSGTYGKPIRLNGPRDAIIDASENMNWQWEPAPEVGPFVYRTAVPFQMYTVVCREGLVIPLNEPRVTPGSPKVSATVKDRKGFMWVWDWRHNLREGVGQFGWKRVKALTMYHKKRGEMLIAFGDKRDPREEDIRMAPKAGAVTIENVDRCVVSGITIRHGWYGVLLNNSRGSVVENCRIERSDFGVRMEGKSQHCTVRFCDISMDSFSDFDPWIRGSWDTWQAHKIGGFWDRIGVDIRNSIGGHRVHDNYIHHHWGGVQDIGNIGENRDLEVHHNRIDVIADDGLEPNGAEENCRWHDNVVSNSRCGFRIKSIHKGPLYAFNNIFMHNREDYRNFRASDKTKALVYVYFNTSTSPVGININKVPRKIGTPNYHYLNNIFYCECCFKYSTKPEVADPDWQEAGNLFVRRGNSSRWDSQLRQAKAHGFGGKSRYLSNAKPGFQDYEKGNLALTADSPARKAGVSLTKYKLPGLSAAQKLKSPDVGALPFGTPMPQLPRKQEAVKAPPAGFWP